MLCSRILPALLLLSAAAAAEPQLTILTASVDLDTRAVRIELQNRSSKVVTAYMLAIQQLDASEKLVNSSNVGFECLSYNPEGDKSRNADLIQPGRTTTASAKRTSCTRSILWVSNASRSTIASRLAWINTATSSATSRALTTGKTTAAMTCFS